MRRLVIAGITAATLSALVPAAHAQPSPQGQTCSVGAVRDPQVEWSYTGTLSGGPVDLGDDADPTAGYTGHLVCTIQTGANDRHAESEAASISGPTGTRTVFASGTVTFEAGADEDVYVCTEAVIDGGPLLYFDAATRTWTTDASASCDLVILVDTPLGGVLPPVNPPPVNPPNPGNPLSQARGHVTIHRFPATTGGIAGARLWVAPVAQNGAAWACTDVHTGLAVAQGSMLTTPHPGVSCTPPAQYTQLCSRVDAGGYHADAGSGTVRITSACTNLSTSATVKVPESWPGYSTTVTGTGATPWSCTVQETLAVPDQTDYWTFCDVNLT
jgi:hypothetical protein